MKKGLLALAGAAALAVPALGLAGDYNEDFERSAELRQAVTLDGVTRHLNRFQNIADRSRGNRASGFIGYDRSAQYVVNRLEEAGYAPRLDRFEFETFEEVVPAELEQVSPDPTTYVNGEDFEIMDYSGSGNVTRELVAVDLILPPTEESSSTSGCSPRDYPPAVEGRIALIQRGFCTFRNKARRAEDAGALGVIIFNEGQADRSDLLLGTLDPPHVDIPVVGTTFAVGEDLANGETDGRTGTRARLFTRTRHRIRETVNVIAHTPAGDPDNVVMAGAHLDSVTEGPGINDNGSGSAGLLETAIQMQELGIRPENRVRFAWWGAEEAGLFGSEHYVEELTRKAAARIALYLNFDMIGSPNFARFIYDGNGSKFGTAGPAGSGAIERAYERYFERKGLASGQTEFDGRSDYGPFIEVGIPAGGLFTGAEDIKTAEEQAVYGGTEGEAYDPCYHQACDTSENISATGLNQMTDALAHSVHKFAFDLEFVRERSSARSAGAGVRTSGGGHGSE